MIAKLVTESHREGHLSKFVTKSKLLEMVIQERPNAEDWLVFSVIQSQLLKCTQQEEISENVSLFACFIICFLGNWQMKCSANIEWITVPNWRSAEQWFCPTLCKTWTHYSQHNQSHEQFHQQFQWALPSNKWQTRIISNKLEYHRSPSQSTLTYSSWSRR